VLFLSDVRNDTSDTFHQRPWFLQAISRWFNNTFDMQRLHSELDKVEDRGVRALVEQQLCANSAVMVGCPGEAPGQNCKKCSRIQSKFAKLLLYTRHQTQPRAPVISW